MNNLGVNEMFDFTQYSITDDDYLAINLSAIRTNEFESIQIEACDLPINYTEIAINLDKIRFIQNTHVVWNFHQQENFLIRVVFQKSYLQNHHCLLLNQLQLRLIFEIVFHYPYH